MQQTKSSEVVSFPTRYIVSLISVANALGDAISASVHVSQHSAFDLENVSCGVVYQLLRLVEIFLHTWAGDVV